MTILKVTTNDESCNFSVKHVCLKKSQVGVKLTSHLAFLGLKANKKGRVESKSPCLI